MTGDWSFRRHCHAALRFGLLAALIVFIFWGIFDLFGSVPTITTLGCDEATTVRLPFAYSRWLDVPSAFLYVIVFWVLHYAIVIIANAKQDPYRQRNVEDGLACGALIGLLCGIITAILTTGLPAGVIVMPILLTIAALFTYPLFEEAGSASLLLTTSFISGAFVSLMAGVGIGLVVALGMAMASITIVILVAVLVWLIIEFPTKLGFWRKVWDLLTAADVNGK